MHYLRILPVMLVAIMLGTTSAPAFAVGKVHKVAIHVDKYCQSKGDKVEIEIVAYRPGLNMLREDTSPVKMRIASMAQKMGNISFAGCSNTKARMAKKAGKEIKLIAEAKIVPSGVVRLMELQEQGWS